MSTLNNPFLPRARVVINAMQQEHCGDVGYMHIGSDEYWQAKNLMRSLRGHYAYGIPNEDAARALADVSPIVEIGAGTGYWAWMIEQAGGHVRSFDKYPPGHSGNEFTNGKMYHEVIQRDHSVAREYPESTLFLCWPSDFNQKRGWSDMALEEWMYAGGDTVALVGEGKRGATGSDRLYELLEQHFKNALHVGIPRFPDIYDSLTIYQRI